jgi:hypothetical protein
MSYYEDRIKALEARVEEMAMLNRIKAIPVEAKLIDRIAELNAENARLKAEVERLTEAWVDKKMQEDRDFLLQQVERLTKAGDELHAFLINYIVESRISSAYLNKLDDDWNAAKEGKDQP